MLRCGHALHSNSLFTIYTHNSPSRTLDSVRCDTDEEHSRAPAPPQVEHTPDDSVHSLVDVDSPHISSVPSDYESQSVKTDTQAERIQREDEVKEEAKRLREKAAAKKESAKEKARKNADNPVVIGNAVGLAIVGGIVGFGAYRQYARGELTGKVVAAWAAALGLFGIGDYYVSQYV